MGSVGCLKDIKEAISVARSVMEHTNETLLVGDDGIGAQWNLATRDKIMSLYIGRSSLSEVPL